MLEQGSLIKLADKYEYVVVFSTMYEGSNYVFVTNTELPVDSCFFKNNGDGSLERVKDENIIKTLLNIYQSSNK